jgi:hypothetical protein
LVNQRLIYQHATKMTIVELVHPNFSVRSNWNLRPPFEVGDEIAKLFAVAKPKGIGFPDGLANGSVAGG